MNLERLSSVLLSLCLHLGMLTLVLFWPAPRAALTMLPQGKFIPDLITLGKSGKDAAEGRQALPEAAKGRPDKPPAIEKPRADRPENPAPRPEPRPSEVKPPELKPSEVKPPEPGPPEVKAVEKAVEKPAPDTVAIPKTPDTTRIKPASATQAAAPPKTAQAPADSSKGPRKKTDNALGSALADLTRQVGSARGKNDGKGTAAGKGQDISAALADLGKKAGSVGGADSGRGPGGSGGDGYGMLGAYQDSIVSRVRPNWSWPGRTDRKNYTAVVNIQIEPNGAIKNARIVTSSGNAYFDATVLQALAATTNLEPPPDPAYADINIRFSPENLGTR